MPKVPLVKYWGFVTIVALLLSPFFHPNSALAAKSEVAYNNREYVAIRNAAIAASVWCAINRIKSRLSRIHEKPLNARSMHVLRGDFRRLFRGYSPMPIGNCWTEGRDLVSVRYWMIFRPSYNNRTYVSSRGFQIIPNRACAGRNEGGVKGRRRWQTCASFCSGKTRCDSFEVGTIEGSRDRICTLSYSCNMNWARSSENYDLWLIYKGHLPPRWYRTLDYHSNR